MQGDIFIRTCTSQEPWFHPLSPQPTESWRMIRGVGLEELVAIGPHLLAWVVWSVSSGKAGIRKSLGKKEWSSHLGLIFLSVCLKSSCLVTGFSMIFFYLFWESILTYLLLFWDLFRKECSVLFISQCWEPRLGIRGPGWIWVLKSEFLHCRVRQPAGPPRASRPDTLLGTVLSGSPRSQWAQVIGEYYQQGVSLVLWCGSPWEAGR